MKGIDVSAWQTDIDWQVIVDAGIEFVIIKLGQGTSLDNLFVDHINGAIAAGLKVGVYHYAMTTSTTGAQTEADWVAEQISQYLNGQTPEMGVWYDVEDPSIESAGADITAICAAFINKLKTAGHDAGIYSSYNWMTNGNINTKALGIPLWCAQYNSQCDFNNPNLRIWQYTDHVSDDLPYDGNITMNDNG
jgi:GH25 family lysozyme M1 (1,4-beta-N-acetylmuramidase)